jgi:predicted dehydrogenase
MVAPKLSHKEALQAEAEHIVACVKTRAEPLTSGATGLEVIRVLEAAQHSIKNGGVRVTLTA